MQSTRVDIVYYTVPTDFEMEFNLSGCCRMRLLTETTHSRKDFVTALSRAVSRSQIIMLCGPIYGDDGLIYITSKAIGKPLRIINNNDFGIVDEQNVRIIDGSLPLVSNSGIFGGIIIESGPQTIIILSENKNVRNNIMNSLIHPYIQEMSLMGIRNSSESGTESADTEPTKTPETEPAVSADYVAGAAEVVAAEAAAILGEAAAEIPEVKPDEFVTQVIDILPENDTVGSSEEPAEILTQEQEEAAEEITEEAVEETAEEVAEEVAEEDTASDVDNLLNILSEEPAEAVPSDESLAQIASEINRLNEEIERNDTPVADIPAVENLDFYAESQANESDDFPDVETLPESNPCQIDFTIDTTDDETEEITTREEKAEMERNFVESQISSDGDADQKPVHSKEQNKKDSSHAIFLFEEPENETEEKAALENYLLTNDDADGNNKKKTGKKSNKRTKPLTASIIIIAVLLFLIIAALCYFIFYIPYQRGISTSEFLDEIFNASQSVNLFLR